MLVAVSDVVDRVPGGQPGRRERLALVMNRDGVTCVWCGRELAGLVGATTEHLVPRVKGGPSWVENELAACRRCNGERGHVTPGQWLDECERRGWPADRERVRRSLLALRQAIAARGGQRKARHYVESQLRRV
jgi:5-methylcytosine-specific restriction endonuclease McrA